MLKKVSICLFTHLISNQSHNTIAALQNILTGKEVEPVKSTVPTPPTATSTSSRKKQKSTPIDLSSDLVEEKASVSTVVDVVNSCGLTFEWRDVAADVNKVTAIINLPTGVDPQKVDIKLPVEAGSNLSANVLQIKFEYVFSLKIVALI